jgi:hypothetical protein
LTLDAGKAQFFEVNADMDLYLYRYHHLVENAFNRLKQYRTVAAQYDKLKRNFGSMVAMHVDIYDCLCEMSTTLELTRC